MRSRSWESARTGVRVMIRRWVSQRGNVNKAYIDETAPLVSLNVERLTASTRV